MSITNYHVNLTALTDALKEFSQHIKDVVIAVIFGSVLRRSDVRDVDVAVYTRPKLNLKEFLLLRIKVEELVDVPVDLIPIDEMPPQLQYTIFFEGLPIVIRDFELYNRLICMTIGQLKDITLCSQLPNVYT